MTITWRTHQVENGFNYEILGVEYQKPVAVLLSGFALTRAKAVLRAKRHCMAIKRNGGKG